MQPGEKFSLTVDDNKIVVVYTKHFVDRFHLDEPGRPAVCHSLTEEDIRVKIVEGSSKVAEYYYGDPGHEGVYISRTKSLNMTYVTVPSREGFTMKMKNMMIKTGYEPKSLRDYIVSVNPPFQIRFAKGIDPVVRSFVIGDLMSMFGDLNGDTAYHIASGDGEVEYWVDRRGDIFYVDEADWIREVVYVSVS
ncbi:MAG: hypothetical protein A2Z34_05700 [Planctomycetes bacterium RBG_16_59_8]|nr:MAG: hypothetical protein A2Z34_05700 [Planctomycetes bacterium RBG_16_59_8]